MGNAPLSPAPQGGTTQNITCTLNPLCAEGADALKPCEKCGVVDAKLVQLDLAWENRFHEISTKRADDLFDTTLAEEVLDDPIPPGAHPVRAIIKVQFEELPAPHFVEIRPPATIIYQDPQDTPRLALFLSQHNFTRKLAQLLLILLALAGAFVPDLDDDDDDNESGDAPHVRYRPA